MTKEQIEQLETILAQLGKVEDELMDKTCGRSEKWMDETEKGQELNAQIGALGDARDLIGT